MHGKKHTQHWETQKTSTDRSTATTPAGWADRASRGEEAWDPENKRLVIEDVCFPGSHVFLATAATGRRPASRRWDLCASVFLCVLVYVR